jgi:hypothetical protein
LIEGDVFLQLKINKLTSAEIAAIWTTFMNNSLLIFTLKYFIEKNEDKEIRRIIKHCINMFNERLTKMTSFFAETNYPIPCGFTDQDVNVKAPRLYTDNFVLFYLLQMARTGVGVYSTYLPLLSRQDILDFFVKCISQAVEVSKWITEIMLLNGIFVQAPLIDIPAKIDYVKNEDFLGSWLGREVRALHAKEITFLFSNIQTNVIGKTLITGFSQVAESEKVREYMVRGEKIAAKHIEIFTSILRKEDILPPTPAWNDMVVTDSTVAPFSDKLMVATIMLTIEGGMGFYGIGLALDTRHDLVAKFMRLMTEIGKYGADGIKIMINNGWLEQPPQAIIPSTKTSNDIATV